MSAPEISAAARIPELVKFGRGMSSHEEPLRIFGEEIYIKTTGKQTGGAWAMIEQVSQPGGGPPLHCHAREDEGFFIVEGSFLFQIGEDRMEAHPGDFLWAPRDIPHTFVNIGSTPSRGIVVMSPSGMEDFFLKVAAIPPPAPPDQIAALFVEFGLQLLGPPIAP